MINLDEFIQAHKLSCQSRHKESGQFAKYPCTCGRDEAVKQLSALRADLTAYKDVRQDLLFEVEGLRAALEEAKAILKEANETNSNADGEGYGAWNIYHDFQKRIDAFLASDK